MREMTHGLAGTRPSQKKFVAPVPPASLNGNARHLTQITYRHTTGILQAHLLRHRQKWLPPIFLSGCFYKLSLPELQAGCKAFKMVGYQWKSADHTYHTGKNRKAGNAYAASYCAGHY